MACSRVSMRRRSAITSPITSRTRSWTRRPACIAGATSASSITEHRVVDTTQFGWNGQWQVSNRLKLGFDVYTSESERDSGGKDTWVVSGIGGSHTARVDMNSNSLPDISVMLEDGRDLATSFENGELGNADYGLHYIGLSGTDVTDEITGTTLSGTLDFDNDAFKSLEFG